MQMANKHMKGAQLNNKGNTNKKKTAKHKGTYQSG